METLKLNLQDKDEWQDPTNVNFKLLGQGKFILMQINRQKNVIEEDNIKSLVNNLFYI